MNEKDLIEEITRKVLEHISKNPSETHNASTHNALPSILVNSGDLPKYIDHTLLKADAKPVDIEKLCNEAKQYHFFSVCVNGSNVAQCAKLLEGSGVKVCSVVGFPLGAMSFKAKAYETSVAIKDGAREIDMVMNIGP